MHPKHMPPVPPPFVPGPIPWEPGAKLSTRPRTPQETRHAIDSFFRDMQEKHRQPNGKTVTQRMIDGELGPCAPMEGVTHYPYTMGMKVYQDEFSAMVCSSITHPYVTTAVNNRQSIPFDMLSGMAYDDARLSGLKTWHSEAERAFKPKSITAAKNAAGVGIRSECVQFIN